MPRISICIPAYRDAAGVRRLLDSIYASDTDDIEIIITDDSPDDSVSDVVSGYDRLKIAYHHNETPLGPAGNWNRSIDLAKGEYIKIMHQDDWFTYPDSLRRYADMLDENPEAILAFSGSRQTDLSTPGPDHEFYDRCISDEHLDLVRKDGHNLFLGGYIGAPSAVIFRNCDVRFDSHLKWLIDSDFYIRLLERNPHFAHTPDPLVSIGVSANQLTESCAADAGVNINEHRYLFEKYDLGSVQSYRDKLVDVCVSFGGKYADIASCGITQDEFKTARKAYRQQKRQFYKELIGKKTRAIFG